MPANGRRDLIRRLKVKIHNMLPIKLSHVIIGKTENEDAVIEKLLPQYVHIVLTAMAATFIGNSME